MDPYPSFFAATSRTVETAKSSYLMDAQLSPLSPGALPGAHLLVCSACPPVFLSLAPFFCCLLGVGRRGEGPLFRCCA